jgi:hypothetical protein
MNLVSVPKEISHITMIDSAYTLLSRMRMYVTYLIPLPIMSIQIHYLVQFNLKSESCVLLYYG